MKSVFLSMALLISSSAFALDPNVTQFCQGDVNQVPNTFTVFYKVDQTSLADVTRFLNVVGGLGRTVNLSFESIGPKFNLVKTSFEKELSNQHDYGQFTLAYNSAAPTENEKNRVLNFLTTVSQYPGFHVGCKMNLALPQ